MSRTPRMIDQGRLTRQLVGRGAFLGDPIFVVDVGASGGIDAHWDAFGDQLKAVGFDPLIPEVARLNERAANGVRYVAAWVTSLETRRSDDTPNTDFLSRTSAVRATEVASLDYTRAYYNAGVEISVTDNRILLDNFFDESEAASIDFLKVDTDGHDYDVLLGSNRTLSSGRVLGLAVEAQFQGRIDDVSLFSNIDAFLRRRGFSLFDLEAYRYSRAALPARFVYEIPAQTVTGQVSWGDAVYFRDLGDPRYESLWHYTPTVEDVLKLACFFELFGLPDCAAELIFKYPDMFGSEGDRATYLDVLASESAGAGTTYADLLEEFERKSYERFSGHSCPRDR